MDLVESQRQITKAPHPSSQDHTCKFCLDPCNQPCPCKCSGSMQYVHEQCLLAWINTKSNLPSIAGNIHEFLCQACKSPICVAFKKRYKLVNGCRQNGQQVFTMFMVILVLTASVGFSFAALVKAQTNGDLALEFEYILSIVLLPFQVILLCISIKIWIVDAFIQEEKVDLKLMKDLV